MNIYRFLFFLSFLFPISSTLELTISGVIDHDMVYHFKQAIKNHPEETSYVVYFDTPGGSVLHGMHLLPFFENNNVKCIVSSAYSMGFVLLQACSHRVIEKYGTLMTHDMKVKLTPQSFLRLESYLSFSKKIFNKLIDIQRSRIQLSEEDFLQKIQKDWWMDAEEALENNCVDEIKDSPFTIRSIGNIL